MDLRDLGIRVSYQIKRKRGGDQKEEEKLHPFLMYLKLYSHLLYLLVIQ
jgi:hypothetical protein